jgi:hypothetical protein
MDPVVDPVGLAAGVDLLSKSQLLYVPDPRIYVSRSEAPFVPDPSRISRPV